MTALSFRLCILLSASARSCWGRECAVLFCSCNLKWKPETPDSLYLKQAARVCWVNMLCLMMLVMGLLSCCWGKLEQTHSWFYCLFPPLNIFVLRFHLLLSSPPHLSSSPISSISQFQLFSQLFSSGQINKQKRSMWEENVAVYFFLTCMGFCFQMFQMYLVMMFQSHLGQVHICTDELLNFWTFNEVSFFHIMSSFPDDVSILHDRSETMITTHLCWCLILISCFFPPSMYIHAEC